MEFFQRLPFKFQDYFIDQMKRALTFFVAASKEDLFLYMKAVLTYGPYKHQAASKFISTRDARLQLAECIAYVLEYFLTERMIKFFFHVMPPLYYIPEIHTANSYRQEASHHIFKLIEESGATGAEKLEITMYLMENIEYHPAKDNVNRFHRTILNRLVNLNCVTVDEVDGMYFYKLNFN